MAQSIDESKGLGDNLLEKAGEAMQKGGAEYQTFMWLGVSEAHVTKSESGLVAEIEVVPMVFKNLQGDGRLPELETRLGEVVASMGINGVRVMPYDPSNQSKGTRPGTLKESAAFMRGLGPEETPVEKSSVYNRGPRGQQYLGLVYPKPQGGTNPQQSLAACAEELSMAYALSRFIITDCTIRGRQVGNTTAYHALRKTLHPDSGQRRSGLIVLISQGGNGKSHLSVGNLLDERAQYATQATLPRHPPMHHSPGIYHLDTRGFINSFVYAVRGDIIAKQENRTSNLVQEFLGPILNDARVVAFRNLERVGQGNPQVSILKMIEIIEAVLNRDGYVILSSSKPLREVFHPSNLTPAREKLYSVISRGVVLPIPPFGEMPLDAKTDFLYQMIAREFKVDMGFVREVLSGGYDDTVVQQTMANPRTTYGTIAGVVGTLGATHDPGKRLEDQLRSLMLYACDDRMPHQGILTVGQ